MMALLGDVVVENSISSSRSLVCSLAQEMVRKEVKRMRVSGRMSRLRGSPLKPVV